MMALPLRLCAYCKRPFVPSYADRDFCSRECRKFGLRRERSVNAGMFGFVRSTSRRALKRQP